MKIPGSSLLEFIVAGVSWLHSCCKCGSGVPRYMIIALLLFATLNVPWCASAQNQTPEPCGQIPAGQSPWLREAIDQRYTLRRVELIGNETISDHDLRRSVVLREGDLFSQRNLAKTLVSLNKLKTLYPVTMRNVIVRLDRAEKTVDRRFVFANDTLDARTPANVLIISVVRRIRN